MKRWNEMTTDEQVSLPKTGPETFLTATPLLRRGVNAGTHWKLTCICEECKLCAMGGASISGNQRVAETWAKKIWRTTPISIVNFDPHTGKVKVV